MNSKKIIVNIFAVLAILLALFGSVAISKPYAYLFGINNIPGTEKYNGVDIRNEKMRIAALGFATSMSFYVLFCMGLTLVSAVIYFLAAFFGKCVRPFIAILYKLFLTLNILSVLGIIFYHKF